MSRENFLQDYVTVNERIERFYEKYPNGRINTEIVNHQDGVITIKAIVYRDLTDDYPSATGHASEKEGSSFINKTSALENCETSAVGRALGLLGFEIKKSIASYEEVANAKLQQSEKQNKPKENVTELLLKEKWQLLAGSLDGFDKFYTDRTAKGFTLDQLNEFLNKKLKEKK